MEELADGIFLFRSNYDHSKCDTLVKLSDKSKWQKASRNKYISDSLNDSDFENQVKDDMLSITNRMLDTYRVYDMDNQIPLLTHDHIKLFRVVKYEPGAEFKSHIDSRGEGGKAITGIAYLNDGYKGGSLEYPKHEVILKPQKGDIILHPCKYTHPHKTDTVISGNKYILVFMLSLI